MQQLKYLIIHCTATPTSLDVGADHIVRWHTQPKPHGRGWSRVGYTDLVKLDGTLVNLSPFNQDKIVQTHEVTWGAKGINDISRHVVYSGGLDDEFNPSDTRTAIQKEVLETYVRYMILRHPNILVAGHNQFAAKACPSFDVPKWLESLNIPEKNIYRL